MPETPQYISSRIDQVIDRLNGTWDLQLPRLYGDDVHRSKDDQITTSRRCSSRIRFLCYRSETGIDNAITEFEEEAKAIFSRWVWKPSQEKGTLPSLPTGKSFLKRDIISGMNGPISIRLRETLLQKLFTILDEEFTLAHESESYQRTSSQSFSDTLSRSTSFATAATGRPRTPSPRHSFKQEHQSHEVGMESSKRSNQSSQRQEEKRQKISGANEERYGQRTKLDGYFRKSKNSLCQQPLKPQVPLFPSGATESTNPKYHTREDTTQNPVTSFNTSTSPVPSVFTDAPYDGPDCSQATSFIDYEDEVSQDLFPTQDATEYFADESFSSEFQAANTTSLPALFSFENINIASPFQHGQSLPPSLQYWIRWEIYRVAQSTGLQPVFLYKALNTFSSGASATYDQLWRDLGSVCKAHSKVLPAKSDVRSWMEGTNRYESPDGNTSYFTFNLEYEKEPGPRLWRLVLNPIKVEKGNRIHLKFGAHRHLMGFLNYFDQASLPRWIRQHKDFNAEESFHKIAAWLATETHHLVGRHWRVFYLEPEKKKKTKRQTGEAPRQKLSLFAVSGDDFDHGLSSIMSQYRQISLAQFVNWHIPLQNNLNSTDLKLFSRFGLGLSKTRSTVTIEPHQFRYVPAKQEPDMSDGSALMSYSMGKAIWDKCGDGSPDVPSVFQGRIGGSKGTWVIDYHNSNGLDGTEPPWIEIGESQLKIQPQPQYRLDADESQRTFEVLKWSSPCVPGHLNMQLINILADRGVTRSTLRQVVWNDIEQYIQASRGAMKDSRLLLGWLQDYHSGSRRGIPPNFDDGLPEGKEQAAYFLVQCGFTAKNCAFLRREITTLITQRLDTYVDKLRIEVPYSTSTFCVPDPYQVLEEDEVHLGFSEHWLNPKTGFREFALSGIDVLVSRNPAALASDIQKRKAVYKHELRNIKNVIIFPTKGKVPLASLLSGGDYDGDTVTVIWDPELVDTFCNVEKPRLPTEEQCGLQRVSRQLKDTIKNTPASAADIDDFLTTCIAFNAQPNRVGPCTNEHEKLIYSGAKLSDPGAVTLAALAGYLVDANKQGILQSEESWRDICRRAQGGRKLYSLAYKSGQDKPRRFDSGECVNIMDHLKFDVAEKRQDDILAEFEKSLSDAQNYDIQLSAPYNRELERCRNQEGKEHEDRRVILSELKNNLGVIMTEWLRRSGRREAIAEQSDFALDLRFISSLIKKTVPLERDCDIYRDYISESRQEGACDKGTRWSLLRASAMYRLYNKSRMVFWTVGDELGRIKARAQGMTIETRPDMHYLLKPDTKCIKRLTAETYGEDGYESEDGD